MAPQCSALLNTETHLRLQDGGVSLVKVAQFALQQLREVDVAFANEIVLRKALRLILICAIIVILSVVICRINS